MRRRNLFQAMAILTLLSLAACGAGLSGKAQEEPSPKTDDAKRRRIETMCDEYAKSFPDVPAITAQELVELRKENPVAVVVDARTAAEQAVSTIPGAVSQAEFEQHRDRYRDKTVVAYCTIGYRSAKYVQQLRKEGFNALNLRGSILSWVHAGQTVVDSQGEATKRVHVYGPEWDLLPEGYLSVW